MPFDTLVAAVQSRFSAVTTSQFRDNCRLHVAPEQLFELLRLLKEEHGFDMLAELTAADYLQYPDAKDRFGLMYVLVNTTTGERCVVKTFLNEPDLTVPSAFIVRAGIY